MSGEAGTGACPPCGEVRVDGIDSALVPESIEAWLADVRELADPDFPERDQPPMPPAKDLFA